MATSFHSSSAGLTTSLSSRARPTPLPLFPSNRCLVGKDLKKGAIVRERSKFRLMSAYICFQPVRSSQGLRSENVNLPAVTVAAASWPAPRLSMRRFSRTNTPPRWTYVSASPRGCVPLPFFSTDQYRPFAGSLVQDCRYTGSYKATILTPSRSLVLLWTLVTWRTIDRLLIFRLSQNLQVNPSATGK